jgi:hypothetical protein
MNDAPQAATMDNEDGIRLARRRKYGAEIVLADPAGHGEVRLVCRDVSVSGLFVYAPACVEPGSEFVCRFTVDEGAPVEVRGAVSRVLLDHAEPARSGMGIRFVELAREARERIVRFTASPAPVVAQA